jgi:glutamyl/glutaminyl-tRNA synthetase
MVYEERFSDVELAQVISEGLIYMCACPAQVAEAVRKVRELYRYQMNCQQDSGNERTVHQTIAKTADRKTLQMPQYLRAKQLKEISSD